MENVQKESFKHIVSLGYNCDIANGILSLSMRDAAYPFDWNFSKMWKINETMRCRLSNIFLLENLVPSNYKNTPSMEKDKSFIYIHNGSYERLQQPIEYAKERDKYDRRILRLLEVLDTGSPVLFVRLVYQEDTIEEHLEFVKIIEEHYPKSIFKLAALCPENNNLYIEHTKIDYINGIKKSRYIIGECLREKYDLPMCESIKKEY